MKTMKKFLLTKTVLICLSLFSISNLFSQTIEGGCTSVRVNSIPYYSPDLYFSYVGREFCDNLGCCIIIKSGSTTQARHWLEQKDHNTNSWSTVQGPQNGSLFSNLSQGTYRVRTQIPEAFIGHCTGGQSTPCYNTLGQYIGRWGRWAAASYSNEAMVGIPQLSDVVYEFVDVQGGDLIPNGFDQDEIAYMDASNSVNYDLWWLAIFETGGAQRYRANGWTHGQVNGLIDLKQVWNGGQGWEFDDFNSYTIQFAVQNEQCKSWTNVEKSIFICPTGTGCRFSEGYQEEESMIITPQPANQFISISGMDVYENDYTIVIRNLNGQEMVNKTLSSPNLDTSDLPTGVYSVQVSDDSQIILHDQLIIQR